VSKTWNKWYTNHQSQIEYYESQQAAIVALSLIIPSYANGIWDRNESYLYIGYDSKEIVRPSLFG
jgi:hypothetical protein